MAYTQPEKEYIKRLFQAQPSLTNTDIRTLIDKRRKKEAEMNAPKEKGVLQKGAEFLQNVWWGAIQAGGELAVGLPGQLSRLLPGDQSADPTSFYNKTQRLLESTKQDMTKQGIETEWAWFWFGKWVMNIAAGSVWAWFAWQGLNALSKTKMLTNLGLKVAEKAPTIAKYGASAIEWLTWAATKWNIGQKIIWGTATGLREGLWFDLASGKAPGAGTIASTVIGGGSPILATWIEKVWKLLTNTLPKSLIARWMTTPSALRNASERLSKLSDDGIIDIEKAPEWMLQKWLAGSKKEIQWQLANIIKESWKNKVALLSSSKQWLGTVPEVKGLQNAMKSVLSKYAKVTKNGKRVIATPWNEELVKVIQSFVNNKNPTALEVEKARSLLWNMQIFTKLWDFADSASKEWLQKVWVNVSKYLDNAFPWFRATNKDIEVAIAMSKAIWLKEAQDSVKNLITFTNLWMGWLWAAYWYSQWGGEWALAWLLLATWWKALLNNPSVTTKAAQALSSPVLKEWLKKWWKVIGAWLKKVIPAITSKIYE